MLTIELKHEHGVLTLKVPYNNEMINKARSIPSGQWSKKLKVWVYPATIRSYNYLKRVFNLTIPEFEGALEPKPLKLHKFKTQPYAHQQEAIGFILDKFGFYIGG